MQEINGVTRPTQNANPRLEGEIQIRALGDIEPKCQVATNSSLLSVLNALAISPKTITEVGFGTDASSLEALVSGFQGLERYTVVERGRIPPERLVKPAERLGPAWGKVKFDAADYLRRPAEASDLVLFSDVFGSGTAYYPSVIAAKAVVEVNPGGVVLFRENEENFREMSFGQTNSKIFSPNMFKIMRDAGLKVRFFEGDEQDITEARHVDIMTKPGDPKSQEQVWVSIKKTR
jgi:hypothetical protein